MVLQARWSKILKDIWGNKSRSLLVIFSIAVGVAAVGMINNAARIIQRDLYSEYGAGNPALLQIYVSPFDKHLAKAVEDMREVESAQAMRVVGASISGADGQWDDVGLHVVQDYDDIQMDKYIPVSGSAKPAIREILLEGQSADLLGLHVGDVVAVEMPDERRYNLTVAGVVHDVYVMPFALLGEATGYVSMETLDWMGEAPYFNRLDIIVADGKNDKEHIIEVGGLARDRIIEPAGFSVAKIQIPGFGSDPGEHWAQSQIKGFILILQIMSVLAMFLSAGLVINTVSAILSQQIKQIGILRSVGAQRRQLIGMYVFNVLAFGILAVMIAIPVGLLGAWWLVDFAASFLNFTVNQIDLPLSVLLIQLGLGILMPVGVALVPILSGTRISVYDAIYQYGLGSESENGLVERLFGKIRILAPEVILALRNTFRKKGRLVFTLITLTLAGAMFVAVFSTRESLNVQINQVERYIEFDALLRLPGGRSKNAVEREALRIEGVSVAEGWGSVIGVILRDDDTESAEFEIVGLPFETSTINPLLNEGEWLQGEGLNQIVVNEDLLDEEPDIRVGDEIVLEVGDKQRPFEVVGIASKHLSGPRIYMDYDDFERLSGRNNQVDEIRVIADPHMISSPSTQDEIAEQLEERFTNARLDPGSTSTRHAFFGNITDTFDIILIILIVMAVLLAIVGGLGLTGTMGMNVLERTREIGVLRAVGASNFSVRQVVVIEGVVVGLLSWILGGILSGPSSWALAGAVINTTLETGLRLRYSFLGLFIWLVIVLLIGVFSSLAPARSATRLRVRDVLDYE